MAQPRLLPAPPQTQALQSNTFRPPPLDGSLSMPQIYDWHFKNNPTHRLFVFAQSDGSIRTIDWSEAVHAIWTGTSILRSRFKWVSGVEMSVVGILAASGEVLFLDKELAHFDPDTIPYFTLIASCYRANYVPFPISPRNSAAAVAHLINKAGIKHILLGHEPAMRELITASLAILNQQFPTCQPPDVSHAPLFEELFLPEDERTLTADSVPYECKGPDVTAVIMHSSGSTAFPKPIYWSNHRIIQAALIPWFGERDLTDQLLSLHTMPMYHGMGILQTMWTASCGLVITAFEPKAIPTVPTPVNLFEAAKATNSDIVFCVPVFIEAWSREPDYVKWLATRSGVLFGGGPLNKEAGDFMTSHGVSIFILYGSSEGGIMSPILPAKVGYDWEYFTFPKLVTPEMVPHGNNTFELVMVSNVFCRPAVLNTRVGGVESYATSDLLVPHPTKKGYWKIFGRTDDQIIHNTGEKTNPGPLENLLNQDPHVHSAVMFGRGRFQAGVLVDPKPAFKFDPADELKLAAYRNVIWPTVLKMNEFAPQHSRLFKEMILVEKPNKPFTYTAKMTVRRQAVIADYDPEIDALYEIVQTSATLNIAPLSSWDSESVLNFVRAAVNNVLIARVGDEDDMFQHGCDSLQATWIRNALLRMLQEQKEIDIRRETRNFVYDHPTVSALGAYVFGLGNSGSPQTDNTSQSVETKIRNMHAMVQKYSRNLSLPYKGLSNARNPELKKVVLVTGTTGELGCYLLTQLLRDPSVEFVYAVNRRAPHLADLFSRQKAALVDRGLDGNILESASTKLLLCESDLSEAHLGLPDSLYQEIHSHVSHIIHSAWPVNFNISLSSFEPNIRGLRNLINFALDPHPRTLLFTSTIGVFNTPSTDRPLAEAPIEADTAAGNGYQQSKWVAEEILQDARRSYPSAKLMTVRVGQLCGGINGAWNTHEWLPAVVQSAKHLRCLPDDTGVVSWIPVHIAAAAIIDFLDPPAAPITHLINPKPTSWHSLAKIIAAELDVPLVSYMEWFSRLKKATPDPKFRALQFVDFFEPKQSVEAFGFPKLEMTNALEKSKHLRDGDCELGEADVRQWLAYWRRVALV